jgi:hypothetical protein
MAEAVEEICKKSRRISNDLKGIRTGWRRISKKLRRITKIVEVDQQ